MSVEDLCKFCGFRRYYRGYRQLIDCVSAVLEDESHLLYVTGLYYEVGLKYCVSPSGIERNIRTLIKRAWEHGDKEALEKITGQPLRERPTSSALIEMFAYYLKENES